MVDILPCPQAKPPESLPGIELTIVVVMEPDPDVKVHLAKAKQAQHQIKSAILVPAGCATQPLRLLADGATSQGLCRALNCQISLFQRLLFLFPCTPFMQSQLATVPPLSFLIPKRLHQRSLTVGVVVLALHSATLAASDAMASLDSGCASFACFSAGPMDGYFPRSFSHRFVVAAGSCGTTCLAGCVGQWLKRSKAFICP